MFDLRRFVGRLIAAAAIGVGLAGVPTLAVLTDPPVQAVAEPACTGSESIVDGTPTCVPAPVAPPPPTAGPGVPIDAQQDDGGHH
jgi:hypothetical protein